MHKPFYCRDEPLNLTPRTQHVDPWLKFIDESQAKLFLSKEISFPNQGSSLVQVNDLDYVYGTV